MSTQLPTFQMRSPKSRDSPMGRGHAKARGFLSPEGGLGV
jgi:hypothetical protein